MVREECRSVLHLAIGASLLMLTASANAAAKTLRFNLEAGLGTAKDALTRHHLQNH
jgi:hypothetical protein